MAQPAYHSVRHLHLVALKAAAAAVRSEFESGGDFEGALAMPEPLPVAPTEWADLGVATDGLPVDGAFYGHPEERLKRDLPWVEVTLGTVTEPLFESDNDAYVDATLLIRARVQVDHATYSGQLARTVGQSQAMCLAHCARHVVERDAYGIARTYDPAHALGLVTTMSRTIETVEAAPPDPHDQQNATVFDAITSVTIRQGQYRVRP